MLTQYQHLNMFIKFAAKKLNLKVFPKIHFVGKEQNKHAAFGHSVGDKIYVRVTGRHPMDIMRTLAHELIHFRQNLLNKSGEKMREDEANALAGHIMRDFGTTHTEIFKDSPIPEEYVAETESLIPANVMGTSSPSTPLSGGIDTYSPMMGIGLRKRNKPKGLRAIIAKDRQNEKRSETRIS